MLSVGKVIKMPCMRAGLCQYPDEKILVSDATLESMAASAQGIPVVIEHPDQKITDESIKSMPVVGRVADLHYIDGLWWAHFVVDDADAVKLLQSGYGVSTAWYPEKYAGGGTYNNVSYDRELLSGRYEHLAIVKTPRYEMAVNPIFVNSKDGQSDANMNTININDKRSISMIGKIWKKIIQKEELMTNSNEEMVIEIDGEEMPLKDAIEQIAAKKNEKEPEKKMLNGDDKVDVDGEEMTVNELIKAYKASKKTASADEDKDDKKEAKKNEDEDKDEEKKDKKEAKKNEDEEKKDEDKEEKKEAKKNEDDEDKDEEKKDKKEAKKNSVDETEQSIQAARFNALEQAYTNGMPVVDESTYLSLKERVDMGSKRYGSKK